MSYPDTNLCVIGCDSGYYWVSRDNNRTWEKKRLPLNLEIYKISMADSKYGGIQTFDYTKQRNSELYFTNDSCKTWKLIPITLKDTSIKTIAIVNLSIIDSVNFKVLIVKRNDTSNYFMYFELIETKDCGITWELNNTDNNEFLGAQSMLFLSKNTGFIACAVQRARLSSQCSSVVYRTLDGGITWSKVLEQLDKNMVGLRTISFADTLSGVAMGPFGNLWRTTNGGNSWIWAAVKFDSYDNYDFVDISMPTPYIMFGADNWNGKIFKYDANIYTDIPKKDELKDDILIYPNPIYTGQDINIKLNLLYPENIKFELINSLGNIVDASNEMFLDSGSHTINFNARANLLDGVYWLKIIKNGTDIIFKAFVILK